MSLNFFPTVFLHTETRERQGTRKNKNKIFTLKLPHVHYSDSFPIWLNSV
uniref:Uncharacterized protein n=1 Tax=Anguilla anguilla TaxID=7936 RepID=A0A0E9TJN6_ANGAN